MQFRGKLFGEIKTCLKPTAKDLILVGDNFPLNRDYLVKSRELLNYVSKSWDRVFVVPGIAELGLADGPSMDRFQEFILNNPRNNVYSLNNSEFHDGNSLIVGSTFWCGMTIESNVLTTYNPQTIKLLDNWAKDDAEFIGNALKMGMNQKKELTIATYFPYNKLSSATRQILFKNMDTYNLMSGKWITCV